ncbi:MAG: RsbRD N-terminal domain-containing protein, partial [Verrucomicrobiota bacterium]
AVQSDPSIQAAHVLSKSEVVDHFPEFFDSFAEALRSPGNAPLLAVIAQRAFIHGRLRWDQNYSLDEVLREYARLRKVLILRLAKFRLCASEERLALMAELHELLDETMIVSAQGYVARVMRRADSWREAESRA